MHDAKSLKQQHHLTSPRLSKPETVHRCTCPTSSTCRCTTFATCDLRRQCAWVCLQTVSNHLLLRCRWARRRCSSRSGVRRRRRVSHHGSVLRRCGLAAFRSSLVLLEPAKHANSASRRSFLPVWDRLRRSSAGHRRLAPATSRSPPAGAGKSQPTPAKPRRAPRIPDLRFI